MLVWLGHSGGGPPIAPIATAPGPVRGTLLASSADVDVGRLLLNRWVLTAAVCAVVATFVRADTQKPAQTPPTSPSAATAQAQARENRNAPELAEFKMRVAEYVALHEKLESTLPKLPKEGTPEQIDRHQRALGTLIGSSRQMAKQGDVFTESAQVFIRALLKRLFVNVDHVKLRNTIQDENPWFVQVKVNGRYPDRVPLASMPPEVLKALPPLPEELEYRFVGDSLILLDVHAHIVVDLVPRALPA